MAMSEVTEVEMEKMTSIEKADILTSQEFYCINLEATWINGSMSGKTKLLVVIAENWWLERGCTHNSVHSSLL